MDLQVTRRGFLAASTAAGAAITQTSTGATRAVTRRRPRLTYCLNTSTISGQKLPLREMVELTARVGYDGIEPWVRDIEAYVGAGGDLADLSKRIADLGLRVEGAIGFCHWIVDDAAARGAALEQARRDMDLVRQIGGCRIAAPPAGATNGPRLDLRQVVQRYRALVEVGVNLGVVPQLELWGFSSNVSRLGEAAMVAIESGHPDACLLLDVYHIFKGGSDFAGLKIIDGSSMFCFHINDYPANLTRQTIGDKDRIYPGAGVAPLEEILRMLASTGFAGVLSLELFNRDYWAQDAEQVARKGLESMKEMVDRAFG
jgi:2-keto-myo-inositol isomerase